MAIVRTYECGDCGGKFDKFHASRDEPPPECPICQALSARKIPSTFAVGGGTASQAVDITQDVMEKDYGMSDFKDKVHEGEIAIKTPPHLVPAVQNMWKPSGDIIAAAKVGAQAAAAEGRNPVTMMQRVSKKRYGAAHRVPISVVTRG